MKYNLTTATFFSHHIGHAGLTLADFSLIFFYRQSTPSIQWIEIIGRGGPKRHFDTSGLDVTNPEHWTEQHYVMHLITHHPYDLIQFDIGYTIEAEEVELPPDFLVAE